MKIFKRILSILLSIVLTFSIFFSSGLNVKAISPERDWAEDNMKLFFAIQESTDWETFKAMGQVAEDFFGIVYWSLSTIGAVVHGDVTTLFGNIYALFKSGGHEIGSTENGYYLTDDTMKAIKDLVEEYKKANSPQYVVVDPVRPYSVSPSKFATPEAYAHFQNATNSHDFVIYSSSSSMYNTSEFFYAINPDNFGFFYAGTQGFDDYMGGVSNSIPIHICGKNWETSPSVYAMYEYDKAIGDFSYVRSDTHYRVFAYGVNTNIDWYSASSSMLVFRTRTDAIEFLNGYSKIYQGTSLYNGGGLVIGEDALNYDYEKLYATIQKAITDSGGILTPEQIQAMIEAILKELMESIGGTGSGGSADLTSVESWLEKIHKTLEKILSQVKQIKWLSVADLIDDILFNILEMKGDFEPVLETMSKKFPFSIPWDAMMVFSLLSDTPETPYYEIPFVIESAGINEILIIDLARFEGMSKISRFLLTLTFLMMLFALSRKIAQWFNSN